MFYKWVIFHIVFACVWVCACVHVHVLTEWSFLHVNQNVSQFTYYIFPILEKELN